MIRLIEKIIDYYIGRSIINKIVMLFISTGLLFIGQSIFGQFIENYLVSEFGFQPPNMEVWGAVLIAIGLLILIIDIKYKLIPSVFATLKNTRVIFLGDGRYQFVFDKKMRTVPSICFLRPSHAENNYSISSWDENGFIVQFDNKKKIEEMDFWADAWKGLGIMQKFILKTINLFRRSDNKIEKHEYEEAFSNRQIKKINTT